jgi:hypothetical protein
VDQIRKRLTYANVMSSIAIFLVLGGATAFAAATLGKNSVGTKQLKKNAVTSVKIKNAAVTEAKIKNAAVTEAKIKDGAVTNAKLADGSVSSGKVQNGAITGDKLAAGAVTGASIDAGSTPFTQITGRVRNAGPIDLSTPGPVLVGTYNQPPNEDDIYLGGLDVTFQSSCAPPRQALAYLMIDPENPAAPEPNNIAGSGLILDKIGGTLTKHLDFSEYSIGFGAGMKRMATGSPQTHTFYIYRLGVSCSSGSGVAGSNLGVDVLGTK